MDDDLNSEWFAEGERMEHIDEPAPDDDEAVPDLRVRVGLRLWAAGLAVVVLIAVLRALA